MNDLEDGLFWIKQKKTKAEKSNIFVGAIAAIENALGIMKEVELNETGRDIVETTRNITATIAIQVKKEQE